MTQIFAFTAMMKNAEHWAVKHPEIEVRPWAGSAADLLNEYFPDDMAQKAIGLNAGLAVVVGIVMMVYKRAEMDAHIKRSAQQPASQVPQGTHPQEPVQMVHRRNGNATPQKATQTAQPAGSFSGGASPTRPTEPLVGLGLAGAGLT